MEGLKSELKAKGGTAEDWDVILSEGLKFSELAPYVAGAAGVEDPLSRVKSTLAPGIVVEYQCYDSRWREQGRAIFEVVSLEEEEDKVLLKGIHVCASDGYYEYYASEKLKVDGCLYHFCSGPAKSCRMKLLARDRRELIHVDQWKVTNAAQMIGNAFSAEAGLSRARDGVARFVPHPVLPPGHGRKPEEARGTGLDDELERIAEKSVEKGPSKKKRKAEPDKEAPLESPGGTVGGLLADRARSVADESARVEAKRKKARKSKGSKDGKKKRRGRRSDDSDSEEDSSDEASESSSEVFRSPLTRGGGDLFRLSKKYPGRLLKSGLKEMGHYLADRIGGDPEAGWQDRKVMAYINQVLLVQHPPQQLGLRNLREAQTLGQALDLILEGQVARAGDLLMQRLKALESAVNDQSWNQARHQELIAPQTASLSRVVEKEQAAKLEIRAAKLRGLVQKKTAK